MNETALTVTQPQAMGLETSSSASAALAKATIEAKFTIALHRPRSVLNARAAIMDACKRPAFAQGAWYKKPVGKGVEGFSIRFAEQALNAWRNVDVAAVVAWENDEKRLLRITVTDLESNLSYTDEVLLDKTVERSSVKEGQEVLRERTNSYGNKVFIVRATEDDMLNKVNAAKSKAIRNSGLRLIPQDILEEAEEAIRATRESGGKDPQADTKKLADAFNGIGVCPSEIELYLGHALSMTTPKEIAELRSIYSAIKDGEAKWTDYTAKAGDDEIPMGEPSKVVPPNVPLPTTKPAAQSKPKPTASPQDQLQETILTAGFNFDDLVSWGEASGNIDNARSLTCFSDIPTPVAARLNKNKAGLIAQLAAAKGGAQ